ncbi:hypothetical protein BV22DRAFT_1129365 [Leucogyrophana mollusca]|uniref:Uncharacterized protein n=1 Tax=Leucogyrophana mollusca TaxID=85980 RepID=A0ACB8BHQ8_9AGAM|nr:hypothetical protein BV22DRAFT_1129365 [Leucogyrophana mollusca]
MSFDSKSNTTNTALNTSRPAHHIHDSSEPLPGSKSRSAAQAQDYSPASIERTPSSALRDTTASSDAQDTAPRTQNLSGVEDTDSMHASISSPPAAPSATRTGAGLGERDHADMQPGLDTRDELPAGPAKTTDKVVGKAQQVVGKATKNVGMQEKGELRGTGGKAAVQGDARIPRD